MEDSNTATETTTTTTIELDFRLDEHGRTTTTRQDATTSATTTTSTEKTKITIVMDYSTRCIETSLILQQHNNNYYDNIQNHHLYFPGSRSRNEDDNNNSSSSSSSWYDDVLYDCEIADSGLMPRTFWVPATAAPRCTLEQWALDIFHHHVRPCCNDNNNNENMQQSDNDKGNSRCCIYEYDPTTSGAEWWVQIRPQLSAQGRYAMHASSGGGNDDSDSGYDKNGICFHWDKDEDLRIACGGNLYIHPHVSTVTYLTSHGAPTMVVEHARIHNVLGSWILPPSTLTPTRSADNKDMNETKEEQQEEERHHDYYKSFISWPSAGKHLSFDGRFVHAAPSNLLLPATAAVAAVVNKTTATTATTTDTSTKSNPKNNSSSNSNSSRTMTQEEKREARRGRRISFLVNIWLNYTPLNVEPFPETMLDMMSGSSCNFQSCRSESASAAQTAQTTTSSTSVTACPASAAPARPCLRFGKLSEDDATDPKEESLDTTSVTIANGRVVEVVPPSQQVGESADSSAAEVAAFHTTTASIPAVETFTWPMGNDDSGEILQMQIPLKLVQEHQAQLDTNTTTTVTTNRRRRGGNIHIHYVPITSTSTSTTTDDPTGINNLGVVLLKNDGAHHNGNSIDDDYSQHQPREKRTALLDDDDGNDNPHGAKRPFSDDDNNNKS
jgi:hypothetical protein